MLADCKTMLGIDLVEQAAILQLVVHSPCLSSRIRIVLGMAGTKKQTGKVMKKLTRARKTQLKDSGERKMKRKAAARELNKLAEEVGVTEYRIPMKELAATEPKVDRLIRVLQPRCQRKALLARLRSAAEMWSHNNGALSQPIVKPPVANRLGKNGEENDNAGDHDDRGPDENDADEDDDDGSVLPQHYILQPGYILKSKAFMVTFNGDTISLATWPAFAKWVAKMCKRIGARAWAACIEESLAAASQQKKYHLHCYFYWTDGVGIFRRNLDDFHFQSMAPRVDKCVVRSGVTPRTAACHGLFYVYVRKAGTVEVATNFHPWVDYKPQISWIQSLHEAKKMSHEQYMQLSQDFAGHASRKNDIQEVLRDVREKAARDVVAKELAALKQHGMYKPMRIFPEVERFVDVHGPEPKFRRPILAIIGGTNLGKSMLAAHVLQRICKALGKEEFLEVTVENDAVLDFSEFDVDKHGGVVLDGIGDPLTLKSQREVLQGRAKVTWGGRSATMRFAYPYTLCRRAVVATFDLSAVGLDTFKSDHWLSDERNVIQLWLREPAWIQTPQQDRAPATSEPSKQEQMAQWSVAQVVAFLERSDLHGPAQTCHRNGVAGSDLVEISASELIDDLRMTSFAARKVIAARESFFL